MKTYPVIHLLSRDLALEQAQVAFDAGADGVFFISHHNQDDLVVETAVAARDALPGCPVGINLLSRRAELAAAIALEHRLDMVWADQMGVNSSGLTAEGERLAAMARTNPTLQFFASVAFKYQPMELLPSMAAQRAREAGFIPTTSGAGTGQAPDLVKIQAMSRAADGLLAVASGMDPNNIAQFAPYLSHCLVATGISLDEHRLDYELLVRFLGTARQAS